MAIPADARIHRRATEVKRETILARREIESAEAGLVEAVIAAARQLIGIPEPVHGLAPHIA